nr:receptor-type tyrosine-protein phosphatase alpha-like [Crassostrea gigas]XP_034319183.1 receptor-type tyrosine-protein phosphatase alpha-like [Crassostrea gigas]
MGANPFMPAWTAIKAIDGNVSQDYKSNSCAITNVDGNHNTSIWWKVWLQKQFNVAYLEIYFRSDTHERSAGFSIYTYFSETSHPLRDPKHIVYHQDPKSGCPTSVMNVTINNITQGIAFINTRPQNYTSTCQNDNTMYTGIEICEVKVMGCDHNRFSPGCNHLCPAKCKNQHCDAFNGSCIHGCTDSSALTLDCIVCPNGNFISNKSCVDCPGHCKNGASCNKLTGMCDNGCANHWNGTFCNICSDHYYGFDCNTPCGHCINNGVCDKGTGSCPNGCQSHWQGEGCDECKDGFYNSSCTEVCGQCVNGSACNKDTGYCTDCLNNFIQPFCKDCIEGYYGKDCNKMCSNCNSSAPSCNKDTGTCFFGCNDGWESPSCAVPLGSIKPESNSGAVAGGVVAVIIVLVVVGVLGVIYTRRRRGMNNASQNKEQPKSNIPHAKNSSKERKYADLKDNLHDTSPGEYMNEALVEDDGGYYNTADVNTAIRLEDLQRVMSEKSAGENNTFQSEYKRLPVGNTSLCKEGMKQENTAKNRFKTTFPYDHSRVILKDIWNEGENDYINANFMKDYNGQQMYIAAQGPKNNTLTNFWRMIWQENVRFIVMLTNTIENGKNKCTQYWPTNEKILQVGPCKMKLLKEQVYAFYMYRKFTVQNTKSSEKRTITQFHYTAWPDHGTPEEIGLGQFHKAVTKRYQPGGLMLVHCSAGVGRTGTFIGLDCLLKQGRKTGEINVFEFVQQMREDRMTMVQTTDQYIFLHKALQFGFEDKDTVISESDIPTKLNTLLKDSSPLNQRALYKEYKFLQTVKPIFEDENKEDGMKPENKNKNSNMNVIPVSKYRPYLTSYVKGRNDYINAVCVPSFLNSGAFILTQAPLPETTVDLWTLCVDHDVKAIVVLTENREEIQWIPKKGCSSIYAPYTLTSGNAGSSISGVTQDTLAILKDGIKQDVDVFHIPFEYDNAMIKGVELLLEKGKESEFTSVVISKDGAGPSGIFCTLHNAIQQLRIDREVDILTAVRLIHTRRPEVITKLEEYRRCYELLSLSVSEDGIYANT